MNGFRFFLVFTAVYFFSSLQAQEKTDSLENALKTAGDTQKLFIYDALYRLVIPSSPPKAMTYSERGYELAKKMKHVKAVAAFSGYTATVLCIEGKYDEALAKYTDALKVMQAEGKKDNEAALYMGIGAIYTYKGNYPLALENHLKSLNIRETIGDKKGMADSYMSVGNVYFSQGNPDEALKYYNKALTMSEENSSVAVHVLTNIGAAYGAKNDYKNALEYFLRSYDILKDSDDKRKIATAVANIGEAYQHEKKYDKAFEYYKRSLEINKEIGDKESEAVDYINIGTLFKMKKNYGKAIDYLQQALSISREIDSKDDIKTCLQELAEVYALTGNYAQAYRFHKEYSDIKDTLLNEENFKQINEMQAKYETEKKDKELIKKDAEIIKQNAESRQRKTERNAFIIGFLLMIALAFFIFNSYRQKKKANIEISHQKEIIETKQKEILDSIHYARRIQKSLLPTEKYIEKHLKRLIKNTS